MKCLDGDVLHPWVDALGEALVTPEGRGAIASFTASALSLHSAARVLHDAPLGEVLHGGSPAWATPCSPHSAPSPTRGGSPESLGVYLPLGDPALTLR